MSSPMVPKLSDGKYALFGRERGKINVFVAHNVVLTAHILLMFLFSIFQPKMLKSEYFFKTKLSSKTEQ